MALKRPIVLRIAAAVGTMGLIGCYVGYRVTREPARVVQPTEEVSAGPEQAGAAPELNFDGSKSGLIVRPVDTKNVMPGSKFRELLNPEDDVFEPAPRPSKPPENK